MEDAGAFTASADIPYERLQEIFDSDTEYAREQRERLKDDFSVAEESSLLIYSIKVRLADDRSLWKNIEIPGNITLFHLFSEICYQFSLDPDAEYSFFKDATESPFTEYASVKRTKRSKSNADITLSELEMPERHRFILVIYNSFNPYIDFETETISKRIKLELDIIKVKSREEGQMYPRVSRVSSGFRELED